MFARLFGKKSKSESLPTTGGRLVYAIGYVHGRLDVLEPLLHDIAEDAVRTKAAEPPLLIFLGDYVDRGPASKGVIDLVLRLQGDDAATASHAGRADGRARALGNEWLAAKAQLTLGRLAARQDQPPCLALHRHARIIGNLLPRPGQRVE